MLQKAERLILPSRTREALQMAARLREMVAKRGKQTDSVEIIRGLRESRLPRGLLPSGDSTPEGATRNEPEFA